MPFKTKQQNRSAKKDEKSHTHHAAYRRPACPCHSYHGIPRKIRRLYKNRILAGFAGGTADAFTLFERFEGKLEEQDGQLLRAAVELAKDWRTDRMLRRLEAMLIVADETSTLILSGNGDVVEPEDSIAAIGSGGMFALSAARALYHNTEMDALTIARKSLEIASDICVYTNHNIITDELKG